jgi:hypothetical protein
LPAEGSFSSAIPSSSLARRSSSIAKASATRPSEISLSYIDPDAVARESKGSSDELITSTRFSKVCCGTRA